MFFLFLFAHLVADFVLQPYILVQHKRYWHGLFIHGAVVLLCMLIVGLLDASVMALWPQMLLITAIHIATDRWKVQSGDRLFSRPIGAFLLDQVLHISTIAIVLSASLPLAEVWSYTISTSATFAMYASVYTIAAFAIPLGVMTWLDPSFQYAAYALKARVHCMFAGAGVVTLVLMSVFVALPATLLALAVVVRRPLSPHPLDTPSGLIMVLSLATLLASTLVVIEHFI